MLTFHGTTGAFLLNLGTPACNTYNKLLHGKKCVHTLLSAYLLISSCLSHHPACFAHIGLPSSSVETATSSMGSLPTRRSLNFLASGSSDHQRVCKRPCAGQDEVGSSGQRHSTLYLYFALVLDTAGAGVYSETVADEACYCNDAMIYSIQCSRLRKRSAPWRRLLAVSGPANRMFTAAANRY